MVIKCIFFIKRNLEKMNNTYKTSKNMKNPPLLSKNEGKMESMG
jgi:hypothetical protein